MLPRGGDLGLCCSAPETYDDVSNAVIYDMAVPSMDDDMAFLLPHACRLDDTGSQSSGSRAKSFEEAFCSHEKEQPSDGLSDMTPFTTMLGSVRGDLSVDDFSVDDDGQGSFSPPRITAPPHSMIPASLTPNSSPPSGVGILKNGVILEPLQSEPTEVFADNSGERDPLIMLVQERDQHSRSRVGHGLQPMQMSRTFGTPGTMRPVPSFTAPKANLVEHARVAALKENRAARLKRSREWQAKYEGMKDGMLSWCTSLQMESSPCILAQALPGASQVGGALPLPPCADFSDDNADDVDNDAILRSNAAELLQQRANVISI